MDLGTPEKYLQAHFDILAGRVGFEAEYPAPFVADGAEVDPSAHLGPRVVDRRRRTRRTRREDRGLRAPRRARRSSAGPAWSARSSGRAPGWARGATLEGAVLAERASVRAGARVSGTGVSAGETADPDEVPDPDATLR